MTPNRKAASPVQDLGTLGETASKPHANLTINPVISQAWHTCGNSSKQQQYRLLGYLQINGTCTTLEARKKLDILHPASRILSLRKAGWPIDTVWCNDLTSEGKQHRVARYVLSKEAQP
ncbi:MAG: helix-turn-helix domain-containing protein [Proteobacteria bacterium]|nr:hypothetical protein [Desulfobulbaceae bacterium]MBU4154056.1 helix-turn-helix domain-containing protein [Pseudomonadota bacterium]